MEYRPIPDDADGDALFDRYVRYAFRPTDGPEPAEDGESDGDDDERPDPPRVRRGLYSPGESEPVTLLSSYDFATRLRGATVRMGGVATVATPPEHRRQGHVETLLRECCREYRERGTPVSSLWPFDHPFYRQFGWATCSRYYEWSAAPADLRAAASAPAGTWRRLDRDEWEPLDSVHDATVADRELAVDRTAEWWTERVLRSWRTDPYAYCWTDDDGAPGAYVVYRVEGDWGDRTLTVDEFGAVDEGAFGHVLRFLADHDSQVSTVAFRTPTDVDLLDRVDDPGAVDCAVEAGPMLRLVDVPAALEALSYPADGAVVVAVDDPLLPEVADAYALSVTDGAATCERTDDPAAVDVDVGALSQLVCGYRSARSLASAGDLSAPSEAVGTLAALFPDASPYLKERF